MPFRASLARVTVAGLWRVRGVMMGPCVIKWCGAKVDSLNYLGVGCEWVAHKESARKFDSHEDAQRHIIEERRAEQWVGLVRLVPA